MNGIFDTKRLLAIATAAVLASAAPVSVSQSNGEDDDDDEEELEFEVAQLYFELNDTDGDLGIHGLVDGDAWKSLQIAGPERDDEEEQVLMSVWVRNNLRRQGMTEFFFESAEPPFDELTPAQFFNRFPQGIYGMEGTTLEGEEIEGEVRLSHVMAGPPRNVRVNGEPGAPNCDSEELPEVSGPVTIDWAPVTKSHPTIGKPNVDVSVQQYQFVGEIEREGRVPEEISFSVDLPRSVTQFTLPTEFTRLSPDGEVKYEIIVKLENGNQTAVESCFEVESE
jgi:hypothetical protein